MSISSAVRTTPRTNPVVLVPAVAFAALTLAYVAANARTPHPDASGADVLAYTTAHTGLIKVGAMLLMLSAAPLVITAGIIQRTLRGPAVLTIGATLAASALTFSALFSWAGARLNGSAAPDLARTLADLEFLSGGPAYAAGFGLLAAGLAIPALRERNLPRWLIWLGLVVAAVAALSTLGLIVSAFTFLLPVVRFGGLLWLVAVAVVLFRR
ncbi:DUF4386 domain-containing protein [Nocardia yunnanensis]|uniref:DUF4386 domain-containing protein n=1 Tax=Nocardia yunnanensis TaxID=2382165 RepID=A0A386ZJZ0_9NOCA|nr:DUF4386 domain-containing protein [Nocardia yunnanensis]AYF77464.1 DUF4386 domain-containing protein [Nocardia yunnanensis]